MCATLVISRRVGAKALLLATFGAFGLHPFREIKAAPHAVSTQGHLLIHIRAMSRDLCFERCGSVTSTAGSI